MKRNSLLKKTSPRPQSAMQRVAMAGQAGFTLVELLVVIAITTILLGLLFGPIISSFNLTRRARAVAQAQDAARFGLERLSRELSQATYIYDNGLSGVTLPIYYQDVPTQSGPTTIGAALTDTNRFNAWPKMFYARIDLVQPATRLVSGDVIDPTTGQPVGGAELQPGVRGRRVVRYFLGLRYPTNADGSQRLYTNRYEFSTGGTAFNPVILYRAEYDPRDPNLFDLNSYDSTVPNSGGFNDPLFFYADKASNTSQVGPNGIAANGHTYGENWRAISQPVLVSENMDLIQWNRVGAVTNRVEKDINDPFTTTVSFQPVSVVADVATPSTLTSGGVETPAAVPTVYKAKYGAWTYPYKIVVLRGSTNYNPSSGRTPEPFGQLTLVVERDADGNIGIRKGVSAGNNTLSATVDTSSNTNVYSIYSPTTHKLFVKTDNLTFAVDTDRGRIETAFPPLMGARNASNVGVPYYLPVGSTTPQATAVNIVGNYLIPAVGDIVPVQFMVNSRDPRTAGTEPTNLGLFSTDLFADNYAALNATAAGTLDSPIKVFGIENSGMRRGVRILPGTERVIAPISVDAAANTATLATWVRVPGTSYPVQPNSKYDIATNTFTIVPERRPLYKFDYDLLPTAANLPLQQVLQFSETSGFSAAELARDSLGQSGLAALPSGSKDFFLTTSYLWQNNFSRDPNTADATWGMALDPTGAAIRTESGTKPEADIFRVDYATRQQYSIALGARIYDPTDGRVQSLKVTDKVIINNVIR